MTVPANNVYRNGPNAVSGDQFNTFVQTCTTAAVLRTFVGVDSMLVNLQGISVPGDGFGGTFRWNILSTAADDNLNIIVPFDASPAGGAWTRVATPASPTGPTGAHGSTGTAGTTGATGPTGGSVWTLIQSWTSTVPISPGVVIALAKMPIAGTVHNAYGELVSAGGTLSCNFKISAPGSLNAGTSITGLSAFAFSGTVETVGTATAANTFNAGDYIAVTVAGTLTAGGILVLKGTFP